MDVGGGFQPISTLVPGTHHETTLQGIQTDHMVEDIQELLDRTSPLFY